jgi:hypothetical protein
MGQAALTSCRRHSHISLLWNPSAETAENKQGVWDNNYMGVWHLSEDALDSTSFGNNGTVSQAIATGGLISGG